MKVFISGPMSGKPNFNREAFFKAQEELEKLGYSVWNPAWLAYPSNTEFSKDAIHAIDNEALRHCDAIYMLKGWRYSKGARKEREIAITRELDIMYEEELCFSFRFNLSKAPEKNTPVFDKEFALDEEIKNRTNYQLEAIKENIKEKYNSLDRRIKALEDNRPALHEELWTEIHKLSRELDSLSTAIDMRGKDIGSIVQKRCDDNRNINNTLNNLNIRLKAIEKRLSIKPFYAPTEDEKDDD